MVARGQLHLLRVVSRELSSYLHELNEKYTKVRTLSQQLRLTHLTYRVNAEVLRLSLVPGGGQVQVKTNVRILVCPSGQGLGGASLCKMEIRV